MRSRPMRDESIGVVRDSLTERFQRLVYARAKAVGISTSEFRDWVSSLVGEGIALALRDIDQWDESRGDFLFWAFLKTRRIINEELRKMGNRLKTTESLEVATRDRAFCPQTRLQVSEQLKEIFELLTRDQAEALVFRYLLGFSIKDMETLTGRPGVNIYSLLQRAKKKAQKWARGDWRDVPFPKRLKTDQKTRRQDRWDRSAKMTDQEEAV